MFKKVLWIGLIIISILLLPVLVYITINSNELSSFNKTWVYMLAGYLSIASFYIGFYNFCKKTKK